MHIAVNSVRLKVGQLRSLCKAFGLPTSGSVSDLRLMIEGKIPELDRDPRCIVQKYG